VTLDALQSQLEARIAATGGAVVAFSGGVDSSLVAALAARALGSRALAVTAASPAVPAEELAGARSVARAVGIAHEVIRTDELANADYRRNDRFRCFHCKSELYGRLAMLAAARGYGALLSGANGDDAGDWRPGLRAAEEHGVSHPLLELGVDKATVRALALRLDIPSARKPASPCLASRIPYGTPVTEATLGQVERAERALRDLGLRSYRVRHHGDLGRVEVAADELAAALAPERRSALEAAVCSAGYARAVVATRPLRSGSLNDAFFEVRAG
jgi:uncharacterized protein